MSKQNQHKPNVPELRFPEFSGEWEEYRLKDIANFSKGKSISKGDLSEEGVSCILYGELYTRYGALIKEIYSKTDLDTSKLKKGEENQVLIPSSGETAIDIATASTIDTNQEVYIGGDLNIIDPKTNFDGCFISLSINGVNKLNLAKYAQGKSVVHLYNNDIKGLYMKFPQGSKEQKKISDFFSKLDRQIELEEKKLALLEEQKKGYMQKIFSQELRFKDENGNDYPEWEVSSLGKIAHVTKGFTPSTKNNDYWEESKYNWLSIAGLNKKYITEGNKGVTQAAVANKKPVLKNTLVMSFKLTIGRLAILKEDLYTNEAICHFNWISEDVNTEFVYYYLNMVNISSFGARAVKGITLNNESINSIVIKLPKYQEQLKIADFLGKIDIKIELHKKKVQLLSRKKSSLLQSMFL